MKTGQWHRAPSALLIAALAFAVALPARSDEPVTGWHSVRPGETLQSITARYLGSSEGWEDNHALNPEIQNPHLLFPGQRIRVLLRRGLPTGSAQVTTVSRRGEQQPTPIQWRAALERDVLHQRDGIRTFEDSSVQLALADGSRVNISEDSLLFLREGAQPRPQRRADEIEIVVGQADLEGTGISEPSEIEIVMGPARARPATDSHGAVRARARRSESDRSQIMVYEGTGEVEAAGARVELARGTGTSVPQDGPPGPPETLLPAPVATYPAADTQLDFSNPHFAWSPTEGAESYVLELCADAGCAALLQRHEGLLPTLFTSDGLAPGTYFWRITARSPSGLDGYPSATTRFEVGLDRMVATGPSGRVGSTGGPAVGLGPRTVLGPGSALAAEVFDPTGGPTVVSYFVDGSSVAAETWTEGREPGPYLATATATGGNGVQAPLAELPLIWDPIPPEISSDLGRRDLLVRHAVDQGEEPEAPKRRIKTSPELEVLWSVDGIEWLPLLPPGETDAVWEVLADTPQVFLWTRRSDPFAEGGPRFPKGQVLRVRAHDRHSAVRELWLRVSAEQLEIEAVDLVGNAEREQWPLTRAGSRSRSR